MKKLTEFVIRFPWITTLVLFAITGFFAYEIRNVRIDNELTTFLKEDDPAKQFYSDVVETFGSEILAVIGVFVEEGAPQKDIFDPAVLTLISDMTEELEASSIHAMVDIREKIEKPDGRKMWQLVRTEEQDVSPEGVISLATLSHLSSRTIPAEEPGEESEELIEVLDVLPDPPADRKKRNAAIVSKPASYRELPPELIFSQDVADRARRTLTSWDMYKNNLVGEDLRSTAIYVTLPREATIEYETELHRFIMDMLARYDRPDDGLAFHVSGIPMVAVLLGQYMHKDLRTLVPFCFVVMILVLLIAFRRLNGVLMPFLTVSMSVIWTLGFMGLIGKPMTIITSGLPVLLVAVGSAYTIHVVHHFYEQIALGVQKREAILSTMTKIGVAVGFAGLTTVGGFGSLMTSQVVPIREFGGFAAFGALAALIVNFLLVPAVFTLQPHPGGKKSEEHDEDTNDLAVVEASLLGRLLRRLALFIGKRPRTVTVASGLVLVIFFIATLQVVADSNMVRYFRESSPIRISDTWLNKMLGGTTTFSVVIDSKKEGGFMVPANLRRVEAFQKYMQDTFPDYIKKTMSIADYIKKINKTMGKEAADQYRIPDTEAEVYDELMLYENRPEVIESMIDFDRQKIRVLVRAQVGGTRYMTEMKPIIDRYTKEHFADCDVQMTGDLFFRWTVDTRIVSGQKISILVSIAAVFVMLMLIFRSVTLGLICLVPIVLSILGNFTLMALVGFPLDVGTALIASTAVGIGIDYAIHYVNRYRIEREQTEDLAEAVRRTHVTSGKAIIFNAVAVALGFLVLTGSQFIPLIRMGMLTAATMFFAAFATMTTLPALLMVTRPYAKKWGAKDTQ